MAAKDPARRSAAASIAALTRWSKQDTKAGVAPARRGFMGRFENEVDPEGVLAPSERAARANRAMRAHMRRLSLVSASVRARRAAA